MTETNLEFALVGQEVGQIEISKIKIKPRQRKIDINDKKFIEHIDGLAASIKRVGLMHPITLEDDTDELVAGFCRIQAFLKLGHTVIPFVRRSDLSELQRKVMELEENLQRMNLEWWMEAAAIADIDKIQREIAETSGEEWPQYKTAEITGKSRGTVSQAIKVAEAIQINPELVKASGLVSALNAIKTGEQLAQRKKDIEAKKKGKIRTFPATIVVGDAYQLIQQEPDNEYDAIITNFPFGIDLTIGKEQKQIYKDGEDYIVKLIRNMLPHCHRVLKPDSWLVGFFDIRKITYSNKHKQFVEAALDIFNHCLKNGWMQADLHIKLTELAFESLGLTYWLEEAGFDYVQLLPNIWGKPNKTQGMIGDPNKGFIMSYEAFVLAGKGSPLLMRKGLQNLFLFDLPSQSEKIQEVQMPREFCKALVSLVAMGGAKILDPFAGSGAMGLGALDNQCEFKGFELDPKRAENGNLLLQEHVYAKEKANENVDN